MRSLIVVLEKKLVLEKSLKVLEFHYTVSVGTLFIFILHTFPLSISLLVRLCIFSIFRLV